MIELEGVCRTFVEGSRRHTVLDHLDLTVAAGEIVVVLGKSGSGKSTILNLIAGLDLPDEGTVHLGGVNVGALDETARTLLRRERVGFVFQFFHLLPTLTVWENLLLPLDLTRTRSPATEAHAAALLEEVGLADRRDAAPDILSGGEQQRVAVARALVHQPDVVLADEPTGNLDLEGGRQVVALLDRLTRQAGRTLVMVTHSADVVGVADRVVRMERGRLE
jgi:putative ABC transport system ATP-binding protein